MQRNKPRTRLQRLTRFLGGGVLKGAAFLGLLRRGIGSQISVVSVFGEIVLHKQRYVSKITKWLEEGSKSCNSGLQTRDRGRRQMFA